MNAQTLLKTNGAKAGELVGALGGVAEALAKTIEATASPLAETIEIKASTLAKGVGERAVPLAEAVGTSVGTLAKGVEERAAPLAGSVGTAVDALGEDLEKKLEQARREVVRAAKNFRFGPREGLVLGVAAGVLAAVWVFRTMDRQAAADKLRSAGSRVGEKTQALAGRVGDATQDVSSRVGQATQGLTGKAGAIAGQAGERAGQIVQQIRGQGTNGVDEAKQRLSGPAASEATRLEDFASDLDKDTRAAIDEAIQEVEAVQEETLEEARGLALSNGMKVVGFEGTDIGRVQEVREDVFVLDRPKGADLLVPLTEVARIEGTVAYLRIEADRLTKMGWQKA